jgi:hypothetical protein
MVKYKSMKMYSVLKVLSAEKVVFKETGQPRSWSAWMPLIAEWTLSCKEEASKVFLSQLHSSSDLHFRKINVVTDLHFRKINVVNKLVSVRKSIWKQMQ